jgi:D-alanyl-D-alanine carboxypeptidase
VLLAASVLASSAPLRAQAPPTMDEAIAAIRAYAPVALSNQGAPGMAVAITDRTHTIAIITTGLADVATRTPVTADTRFPIGSISKSMTAISLLELHDAGKVDLNAAVQRYLPTWSLKGPGTILVHQLLSHTAGVPDDYAIENSYSFDLAMLKHAHALFAPGASWSYSNDGYGTVGAIVSAVAGEPWKTVVATHVFAPLGMTQTSAYFDARTLATSATGYLFRDGDLVATPPNPALIPAPVIDFVDPAGSVIAPPEDMARYMRFFLNGGVDANGQRLLSEASFAAMTTPDRLANGKPAGSSGVELAEWPEFYRQYGFGVAVFDTHGDHLIGHTGGVSGYTACMQANLTRGFGAIAMSNLVEAPLHPCAIVKYAMEVLRAQSLGQPLPAAPSGPPIPPPAVTAADYAGSYDDGTAAPVSVGSDDAGLYLRDAGKRYRLVAQGHDLFWTDDPRLTTFYVAFERDTRKAVDGFTNGATLFTNANYTGPRTFTHPTAWDALTGRYESSAYGTQAVVRILIVKGKLTIDGMQRARPNADGTYTSTAGILRFDTPFEGKMQRLWVDGGDFYRIDLP